MDTLYLHTFVTKYLFCLDSDEDDDGLPPDPVGICRVSDALQAHTWPHMDMEKKGTAQSSKDEDGETSGAGEVAADGGPSEEGEGKEKKKVGVDKVGLSDLEAKVTASMTASKEETKSKVGKNSGAR